MSLLPCPHCGSTSGPMIKMQAHGPVERQFNPDGVYVEDVYDTMFFESRTNTVRCLDCGKIRRDLILDRENNVVVQAEYMECQISS